MRELGINTIEGWFEPQFDQLTLDYAARNNIGVLMPFELNQDWPYENPNVQQSILDHVSAYVERYKNSPSRPHVGARQRRPASDSVPAHEDPGERSSRSRPRG